VENKRQNNDNAARMNNKQRQDGIREIRLIRNDRVENKRQNNDNAARMND